MKTKLFIILLLGVTAVSWCQDSEFADLDYGKYGAAFLALPRHAHNAGLATATVAWSEDLAGLQYNPALMAYNKSHHATATYTFLTLDRVHYGLNYVTPTFGGFNYGITLMDFGVDDIEERSESGELIGSFDDNEFAGELVFAGQIKGLFAYGLAARYLQQGMGDFEVGADGQGLGYGFDIGIHYKPFEKMAVGASFQNLFSKISWNTISDREDDVVPTFRLGVFGSIVDSMLAAELDIMKPSEQPAEAAVGIQGTIMKVLALRTGMVNAVGWNADGAVYMDPEFYLGAGIRYVGFGLDYAAMKPGSDFGLGHKLSVVVHIP